MNFSFSCSSKPLEDKQTHTHKKKDTSHKTYVPSTPPSITDPPTHPRLCFFAIFLTPVTREGTQERGKEKQCQRELRHGPASGFEFSLDCKTTTNEISSSAHKEPPETETLSLCHMSQLTVFPFPLIRSISVSSCVSLSVFCSSPTFCLTHPPLPSLPL